MDSHIIEERGYFWWSDTPVPPGCFAPEAAITGTLRIDQDGQARLELDNFLRGGPANSVFGRQTELGSKPNHPIDQQSQIMIHGDLGPIFGGSRS